MLELTYRSAIDNKTKRFTGSSIKPDAKGFWLYSEDGKPLFYGDFLRVITIRYITEDDHLVTQAEGQGD